MTEEEVTIKNLLQSLPVRDREDLLDRVIELRTILDRMEKDIVEQNSIHFVMNSVFYNLNGEGLSKRISRIVNDVLGDELAKREKGEQ